MRRLKANSVSSLLLALLMGAMLAILVLPEVDLPDTAFYTNTAPVMVHARAVPSRTQLVLFVTLLLTLFPVAWEPRPQQLFPLRTQVNFLPILYRCLLC